jgi:hypothetical protein
LPPVGLMLFSVGDAGAPPGGGAGVVVVVVVVVLLVVGVWLPLVPQAVVNAPIAMSTAPPATASRRRSTRRACMCNSYLRVNFIGSAYRHQGREYCPRPTQRSAVSRTTILSCLAPHV